MKDLIKSMSHLPRSAATKVAALCSGAAEALPPRWSAIGAAQNFMAGMAHIMRSSHASSLLFPVGQDVDRGLIELEEDAGHRSRAGWPATSRGIQRGRSGERRARRSWRSTMWALEGHPSDGALPALRIVADGRLRRRAAGYGRDYYCRRGYDVWDRLYRAREACG